MRLTQQEVEARMYQGGIARATAMMKNAEDKGEAVRNPYAATLLRDFVLPLSAALRATVEARAVGRKAGHVALLEPLDLDAVAFLTVRCIINTLMNSTDRSEPTLRRVAGAIGATVHQELVLAQIAMLAPELYHTLANDFNRRRSKNVRHRLTVFKMQAKKAGIEWAEWGIGDRDSVGAFLLEQAAFAGLCVIDSPYKPDGTKFHGKRTTPLEVHLSAEVLEVISRIKGYVSVTAPLYGPCVEPPLDWNGMSGGGFHTPAMQRVHPFLVKAHASARELLYEHSMPTVWGCANALQKTAWRVNRRVLEVVQQLHWIRPTDDGELVSIREIPKPDAPEWLAHVDESERTPAMQEEFKAWKGVMREWYTDRKLRGVKLGRYFAAVNTATTFLDTPRLYFVYFADSRGRFYPLTYGVSPQGSDMQKALLQFADGKPLLTDDAVRWFKIHGANKWGFDKAPLAERAKWVDDRHTMIMDFAADPLNNDEWSKADSPLQFLAWCFEYAEWQRLGNDFESRVAVSLDGSCNGLQHFSAMLRDEVGGAATNLTNSAQMQDIYKIVADKTTELLHKAEPTRYTIKWIAHGVTRTIVKRAVMTTPYGVTRRSAVGYVVDDYLNAGGAPEIPKVEYWPAAQALITHAWGAIAQVVVKAREGMDWLKSSASAIVRARGDDLEGVISWVTPSGFLATQAYYDIEEHRVWTHLHGKTRLLVLSEGDTASVSRHASGLAPNFVHSMDAAHLHLTANAAGSLGIDALAMIHDDYGTHAADTQALYMLIRIQFVDMYEKNDPVADFRSLYPECPEPPKRGELDIREVIYSEYFFS